MFDKSNFEESLVSDILTLKYTDQKAFVNGTDIPVKTLKDVASYQNDYIAKATEFAAAESKTRMSKNGKINKVIVQFPFSTYASGGVDVVVDRSKTFQGGIKDADPVTKSKITIKVTDPAKKYSKKKLRALEDELTSALLD